MFAGERYSAPKEAWRCFWVRVGRAPVHSVLGSSSCTTPSHDRHRLGLAQLKMVESIGEKLRLARETRGIALRDISEQTRISMRYLEAIESDDYRRLPGGIFNRSFIRAYAKFVGYDEQEAMDEYARTLRDRGEAEDDGSPKPRSLVYTDEGAHNRSPFVTLLLALVILAALTACVLTGLHFYRRSQAPKTPPATGERFDPGNSPRANQARRTSYSIRVCETLKTKEGEHEFTV